MCRAHGLHNTGVICYFNSLLQLLGGLPSVVEYTCKYRGQVKFILLLKELFLSWRACPDAKEAPAGMSGNLVLFNELCEILARKNISIMHTQEDAGEMLLLLLDSIGDPVLSGLFRGRYQCDSFCRKCRCKKPLAPVEWLIIFAHPSEFSSCHLRSHTPGPEGGSPLNMFLKNNYSSLSPGMACPAPCGGDLIKPQRLIMAPTVILVTFTRLPGERMDEVSYPHELYFTNAHLGSKYTYRWCGTVNHFGTHDYGHYTYCGYRQDLNPCDVECSTTSSGTPSLCEINDQAVTRLPSVGGSGSTASRGSYIVAYHFIETSKYW